MKRFIWGSFFLFITLSGVCAEAALVAQATTSEAKWLSFSESKYPHERELVRKYHYITPKQTRDGRIFIALADLTDDGSQVIFAYIDIFEFCGGRQIGCPFNILYKNKHGIFISILPPGFDNVAGFPSGNTTGGPPKKDMIRILPSKTMGWHDILLEGGAVWKWNGSYYDIED